VIKRIAVLAILVVAPLALLLLLWPRVRQRFTTAAVTVAVVRQPREEVLITGFIRAFGSQPFSIETLRIEEPGKPAYRRIVSLDATHAFELTLGKPALGSYRASLLLGKPGSSGSAERWLATPPLAFAPEATSPSQPVTAREYDLPRLCAVAGGCAMVWGALFAICLRARTRRRTAVERSRQKENSG
jgi:hypothetical protein